MKKNQKILERIEFLTVKYGKKLARSDGKLFKTLKVFYILSFAYYSFISLMVSLLMILHLTDGEGISKEVLKNYLSYEGTTCAFFIITIISFVLFCVKFKLTGLIMNIVTQPVFIILEARFFKGNDFSRLNLYGDFYWKHFIPALLILIFSIFMAVIIIRERVYISREYKKITERVYGEFKRGNDTLSEEEWNEFFENYDPLR